MAVTLVYTCDWCQKVIEDHGEQNSMDTVKLVTKPINRHTQYDNSSTHYEGLWCRSCLIETGLRRQDYKEKKEDPITPPSLEDLLRTLIQEVAEQTYDNRVDR